MNMRQVLALARKKFGNKAFVEEFAKALTASEKNLIRQQLPAVRDRLGALKESSSLRHKAVVRLIEAAGFCADVDGDEPSMSQLKAAVAAFREADAMAEERNAVEKQLRGMTSNMLGTRCRCGVVANLIPGFPVAEVRAEGDSWDEVAAKLQGKEVKS